MHKQKDRPIVCTLGEQITKRTAKITSTVFHRFILSYSKEWILPSMLFYSNRKSPSEIWADSVWPHEPCTLRNKKKITFLCQAVSRQKAPNTVSYTASHSPRADGKFHVAYSGKDKQIVSKHPQDKKELITTKLYMMFMKIAMGHSCWPSNVDSGLLFTMQSTQCLCPFFPQSASIVCHVLQVGSWQPISMDG